MSALNSGVNDRRFRFAMWTSQRILAPVGLSTKSGELHYRGLVGEVLPMERHGSRPFWFRPRGLCPARTSYLRAQILRLKGRRRAKQAIPAVAASMLTAVYYMLRDGVEYRDLGADHYDRRDRTKDSNRFIRRLEELGFKVQAVAAA